MQHFYVDPAQIDDGKVRIGGDDLNHIKNVLRMKKGESFFVADGSGTEHCCVIEEYVPGEVVAAVSYSRKCTAELPCRVFICQGLPKSDKLELIIQKCVELGAAGIVPVAMKRSVVKIDEKKAGARVKRWQAIAASAAGQCGRGLIPEVSQIAGFKQVIERFSDADLKLIAYENEAEASSVARTREEILKAGPGSTVAVLIGPEGGFDETEVELAASEGFKPVSLGRRILRTETAGLFIMSAFGILLGE